MALFSRTYPIASGDLTIEIIYPDGILGAPLDFECINIAELGHGFDDADNLTSYPSVASLSFFDPDLINTASLRTLFDTSPDDTPYVSAHGLKLYLDNEQIFAGYIDKESLIYNSDTRSVEFEAVDVTADLKNKKTNIIADPTDTQLQFLIYLIFELYKEVYPEIDLTLISSHVTGDINVFTAADTWYMYFSHDWEFHGVGASSPGVTKYLSNVNDALDLKLILNNLMLSSVSYAEQLKKLAFEFGLSIGSVSYGKIYCVKRYAPPASPQDITPALLRFSKRLELKNISGVRATAYTGDNTLTCDAGTIELTTDGAAAILYPDRVLIMESRFPPSWYNIANTVYFNELPVRQESNGGEIIDPAFNLSGVNSLLQMNAYWAYSTRSRNRYTYTLELSGVDYSLFKFYSFFEWTPFNVDDYFIQLRPTEIKKNLLEFKTKITAIECLG